MNLWTNKLTGEVCCAVFTDYDYALDITVVLVGYFGVYTTPEYYLAEDFFEVHIPTGMQS